MSHEATNWAFTQRGLKPATLVVLLRLSDRHNPDYGCFPSIKRLMEDCEMEKPTVLRHIDILEKLGLITKVSTFRKNGGQTSNRYILHFDTQLLSTGIQCKENFPPPVKKIAHPPVKKIDTNLVSINPVNIKYISFEDAWLNYPKKTGKGAAEKAWYKSRRKVSLSMLTDKLFEYVQSIKNKEKKFIPHLATWLNQERWGDEIDNLEDNQKNVDQDFRNMVTDLARSK